MFYQGLVPIEESDYEDFAIEISIALAFLFKDIRARVSDHQYETIFFQISSRTNLLSILALYLNTSYFFCVSLSGDWDAMDYIICRTKGMRYCYLLVYAGR